MTVNRVGKAGRQRLRMAAGILAFVLSIALTPAVPAGASSTGVNCGDLVNSSIVLTADLTCPPGWSLSVNADNITIDLAGYSVSPGILVDTHSRVIVKNGQLSGLTASRSAGVTLFGVQGVSVRAESLSTVIAEGTTPNPCVVNSVSVYLAYLTVDHCTLHGGYFYQARQPTVRSSVVSNGSLTFNESFNGVFTGNVFDNAPVALKWDTGNFTFRDNVFKNTNLALDVDGISIGTWGTTVETNVFSDNAIGARVSNFNRVVVRGNVFERNGTAGLFINNKVIPQQLYPVSDNVFRDNGQAPGEITDIGHQPVRGGLHVFNASGTDGPDYPPITLTRNIGSGNAGYLIWALGPQVADGGGNQGPCGPVPGSYLTCF